MSDEKFPELEDLEVLRLRKELLELKVKLQTYEKMLKDNGLLDKLTQMSDGEIVCHAQIAKLKELSDKGVPFQIEEVKQLEILVKTLQIAQGKAPVVEEKKKKEKPSAEKVAQLLQLASVKTAEDE
jgi:hypothetical protein